VTNLLPLNQELLRRRPWRNGSFVLTDETGIPFVTGYPTDCSGAGSDQERIIVSAILKRVIAFTA
jgi:hypothetical protein